jgi:hypothetical protein
MERAESDRDEFSALRAERRKRGVGHVDRERERGGRRGSKSAAAIREGRK